MALLFELFSGLSSSVTEDEPPSRWMRSCRLWILLSSPCTQHFTAVFEVLNYTVILSSFSPVYMLSIYEHSPLLFCV